MLTCWPQRKTKRRDSPFSRGLPMPLAALAPPTISGHGDGHSARHGASARFRRNPADGLNDGAAWPARIAKAGLVA
jgi:hypothetical protein